ncbi:MAG: hypothetical protein NT069_23130 [Planctomycetota bacterium]|nr:hypothetical protein [Planctomycetota bacterium]
MTRFPSDRECEYLQRQAAHAASGMRGALREIQEVALRAMDPRGAVGRHPWLATASSGVAGFIVGVLLTPASHVSTQSNGVSPNAQGGVDSHNGTPPTNAQATGWAAIVNALATSGIRVLQETLLAAANSHFSSHVPAATKPVNEQSRHTEPPGDPSTGMPERGVKIPVQ